MPTMNRSRLVIVAVAALFSTIGADAQWLAALGRVIVARHSIPSGIPFADASSAHWANVPVLAELVFDGLERGLGPRCDPGASRVGGIGADGFRCDGEGVAESSHHRRGERCAPPGEPQSCLHNGSASYRCAVERCKSTSSKSSKIN